MIRDASLSPYSAAARIQLAYPAKDAARTYNGVSTQGVQTVPLRNRSTSAFLAMGSPDQTLRDRFQSSSQGLNIGHRRSSEISSNELGTLNAQPRFTDFGGSFRDPLASASSSNTNTLHSDSLFAGAPLLSQTSSGHHVWLGEALTVGVLQCLLELICTLPLIVSTLTVCILTVRRGL